MGKLNSLAIQRATEPGLVGDGNGLYLRITETGTKGWLFRYMLNGRARGMGLGSLDLVSLSEARIKANDCRKLLLEGKDPIEVRESEKKLNAGKKVLTFDECARAYIESQKGSWRNGKHAQQWTNTLKTYASPVIGHLPVSAVDTSLLMQILQPMWTKKNETASRVRSRLELVLAWAKVHGYRDGENPAVWRNHLDKLLPKRSRVQKVKHHDALPFEEIPEFVSKLRKRDGLAALALEFTILTATRTSEALQARWCEFRLEEELWVVPGDRMKMGIEHRIPLSKRCIEILADLRGRSDSDYVFPGARQGRPLSNTAMLKVLERMEVAVVTHGFRASFRTWSSERTNYPREVCEQALAHSLRDKVESAYRRGDLILKRRALMNDWSKYCQSWANETNTVIPLNQSELSSQII